MKMEINGNTIKLLILKATNIPGSLHKLINKNRFKYFSFVESKRTVYNIFLGRHEVAKDEGNYKGGFEDILYVLDECESTDLIVVTVYNSHNEKEHYTLYIDKSNQNIILILYSINNIGIYHVKEKKFKYHL